MGSQPAGEGRCAEKPKAIISGPSQAEGIARFAFRAKYEDLTAERRDSCMKTSSRSTPRSTSAIPAARAPLATLWFREHRVDAGYGVGAATKHLLTLKRESRALRTKSQTDNAVMMLTM